MSKRSKKQKVRLTIPPHSGQRKHAAALGLADVGAYRAWCREQGFGASTRKTWRQRQEERHRATYLTKEAETHAVLNSHIRNLGLKSEADYKTWCRSRNLSPALHKNEMRREQEVDTARRETAQAVLQRAQRVERMARQAERHPEPWIRVVFEPNVNKETLPAPYLKRLHALVHSGLNKRTLADFKRLLLAVCKRVPLLTAEGGLPCLGPQRQNTYLDALFALSTRQKEWIREPEDWRPEDRKPRQLFSSLARHLLARYDVPAFLDRAWFMANGPEAQRQQGWFLHIGNGYNIRHADIPLPLTKMAAHHFLKAPANFAPNAAFRWGQVRGLGGSERLARAIAVSFLSGPQADEPFWDTVVHWFVNHPELNACYIRPILDYIFNVKYVPREILLPDDEVEYLGTPEPDFSMKGRTPTVLLRRMEAWHQQLARQAHNPPREWESLQVGDFLLEQQDTAKDINLYWTIRELLSSRDLEEEGRAMNNCVASYINACAQGKSSIWSLRVKSPDLPHPQRIMTIEVDPTTKAIVQALGKCNRTPDEKNCTGRLKYAPHLLRRWASQQGLTLDPGAW